MAVRLGGGQGFYGDGLAPLADLLAEGVDYLVCEALAELTLAILQKDRQRDETLGYTRDLPAYLQAALGDLVAGRTRLITNAGGINPIAAGRAAAEVARREGATGLKVATVVGDDLAPLSGSLDLPPDMLFAHAYLGARPIADALAAGANVVITGRVADASLFLAPLLHEFDWGWDDWDRLAAGVLVGHLLECSGQVTGGNYSGAWWDNPDPSRVAFPIAEVAPDGSAVITKAAAAGGMVTFDTVREQLLYEVHDPSRYLNPDVVADFTTVHVDDLGGDRVRVEQIRGSPAPESYKGLVCTPAGWLGETRLAYCWPDAEARARAALSYVRARAEAVGVPVREWVEEYFGVNAFGGPTVGLAGSATGQCDPGEVVGRLAWRADDRESAARVSREVGILGLSGPPGLASVGRTRDRGPTQLLHLDTVMVKRALVDPGVQVDLVKV